VTFRLASLACIVAIAGAVAPFHEEQQAQADSLLEARTSEVASQLRCPVCQGLSIQESPSDLSQQMRAIVRDQLKAGRTPEEVKAYFVSKYGEWILLEPKPRGFNLLVYALPALLVLGGLGVIVVAVRKWTRLPDASRDRIPH
jgi:cytochrome c-type biogenesis protein CcmH